MNRILVNAVSIREGGSQVVLLNLVSRLALKAPDVQWVVAAHPDACLDALDTLPNVRIERVRTLVLWWYLWGIHCMYRSDSFDALFSMTNYLPFIRFGIKEALLVQHAGYFSDRFQTEHFLAHPSLANRVAWHLKGAWIRRSAKRSSLLLTQTAALAEAIVGRLKTTRGVLRVVPHGLGICDLAQKRTPRARSASQPWRLGYVSKFGVQKNFLLAFQACGMLIDRGYPVELIVTLDQNLPENRRLLESPASKKLGDKLHNMGGLSAAEIPGLYDSLDVFAFPSHCESWGFPLLEALARGLPVVASDIPSNREILGPGANLHDPDSASALADRIERLITDTEHYAAEAERSLRQASNYSWDKAASQTLAALEDVIAS